MAFDVTTENLVIASRETQKASLLNDAFNSLSAADQTIVSAELARMGLLVQDFKKLTEAAHFTLDLGLEFIQSRFGMTDSLIVDYVRDRESRIQFLGNPYAASTSPLSFDVGATDPDGAVITVSLQSEVTVSRTGGTAPGTTLNGDVGSTIVLLDRGRGTVVLATSGTGTVDLDLTDSGGSGLDVTETVTVTII